MTLQSYLYPKIRILLLLLPLAATGAEDKKQKTEPTYQAQEAAWQRGHRSDGANRLLYADTLIAEGYYGRARMLLEDFLYLFPEHPGRLEAALYLAMIEEKEGFLDRALKQYIALYRSHSRSYFEKKNYSKNSSASYSQKLPKNRTRSNSADYAAKKDNSKSDSSYRDKLLQAYLQAGRLAARIGERRQAEQIFRELRKRGARSRFAQAAQQELQALFADENSSSPAGGKREEVEKYPNVLQ